MIASHAASVALAGRDDLLRVFVTAPPERRALRVAEEAQLSEPDAQKTVKDQDAARADYLRRFHQLSLAVSSVHRILVRHGLNQLPASQRRELDATATAPARIFKVSVSALSFRLIRLGLTNISVPFLLRFGVSYEISQLGRAAGRLFR